MLYLSVLQLAFVLSTSAIAVQCSESYSSFWEDASVSEPKDFSVSGFGLGCQRQFVFKRGGALTMDQSWTYNVIGLKKKFLTPPVVLNQSRIDRDAPISVVNASAGHFRGPYQLEDDKDYTLLPIQFDGCDRGVPYDLYQIRATKQGKSPWYSATTTVKSFASPDQVLNLKATRDANDKSKVHVSWETYESQSGKGNGRPMGAFIIAGKSNLEDKLFSQYIEDGVTQAKIDVGPLPVNVTVVRYDIETSALSFLDRTPQVQVKLEV